MYARAGAASNPADTGRAFGQYLTDTELNARTHYAAPSKGRGEELVGLNGSDAPDFNSSGSQPVKYDVPSQYKENFENKKAVRDAINAQELGRDGPPNVIRTDPIGDDEVQYLSAMKAQGELADFDRYVNTMIDPRQPGNLKWLMEIYPQFVDRRIQQVHTDYEYALRNQLIDSWGVNTFDDLHFKYLVDQGKIEGPRLMREDNSYADDKYAPSFLSPSHFLSGSDIRPNGGLRLPFASAKIGKQPNNINDWNLDNQDSVLGRGRTTKELAQGMQNSREENQRRAGGGPFGGGLVAP